MLRRMFKRWKRRPSQEKKESSSSSSSLSPEKKISSSPRRRRKEKYISETDVDRLKKIPMDCFDYVQMLFRDTNAYTNQQIKVFRENKKSRNELWKDQICKTVIETWTLLMKEYKRCTAKNKFMMLYISGVTTHNDSLLPTVENWKHNNPGQAIALNAFELRLSRQGWIPRYNNMDISRPERVVFCCDFRPDIEEDQ